MSDPYLKSIGVEILRRRDSLPKGEWSDYFGAVLDRELPKVVEEELESSAVGIALASTEVSVEITNNFKAVCDQSISSSMFLSDERRRSHILHVISALESTRHPESLFKVAFASVDEPEVSALFASEPSIAGRLLSSCADLLWFHFAEGLSNSARSKEETLELARLLDALYEYEYFMIAIGGYGSNFLPLCGIGNWFGDLTTFVDQFLDSEDFVGLSAGLRDATLSAMHSSKVDFEWLANQITRGNADLINNPHIPRVIVDELLEEASYNQQNLIFHPNATPAKALAKAIEFLEDGDELDGLRPWGNMRDDGLNGFNFFRQGEVAEYVIRGIQEWCEENPDERGHIAELFEEE